MIKGHGGFSAKGALFIVNVAKTEQFMNKELRSDTSFRNQDDFEHHNGHTLESKINLISQFVLDLIFTFSKIISREKIDRIVDYDFWKSTNKSY